MRGVGTYIYPGKMLFHIRNARRLRAGFLPELSKRCPLLLCQRRGIRRWCCSSWSHKMLRYRGVSLCMLAPCPVLLAPLLVLHCLGGWCSG